ncbi:MAG: DUF4097 family beta strand repeat protein [Bdellovibrio sp.]|nr:DUF4097 family beta strand repeat protein [Bdellovibrio sp.]
MKQISVFAKVFVGAAILTVLFLSIASYAGGKALEQDPNLISNIEKRYNVTIRLGGMSSSTPDSLSATSDTWNFAPPTKVLSIKNVAGNFHLKVGTSKEVLITAKGNLDKKKASRLLDVVAAGDTLTIQEPDDAVQKLEVYIEVPSSFQQELNVTTVKGDTNIEGLNLEKLVVASVSGDTNLNRVDAKVTDLKTVSGEVEAEQVNLQQIEGSSVSGDLKVSNNKPMTVKFKSVSGDVKLQIAQGEKAFYNLHSLSGKVENKLGSAGAGKSAFTVDIKTTSGDIEIE